jgi:hypothetical protein
VIALLMEAARTSEALVNFYQTTRRNNPEDSHLRTHRHENFKSYLNNVVSQSVLASFHKTWLKQHIIGDHPTSNFLIPELQQFQYGGWADC